LAAFTPKAFFLAVPNELLKLYFERRGELRDFAWNEFTLSTSDPLYVAWCALPEEARLDTEGVFRSVADLATPHGLAVLAAEARSHGADPASSLPAHASPWHRVFHVCVHHPIVFAAAREALRIERLHRRHVRTRMGFERQIPDTSRPKCDELRDALVAYFRRVIDAPDLHCVVHSYRVGERFRYVADPEDLCRSFLAYARGELRPQTRRPVLEVVFTYDPVAGSVEIYAHGDRRRREDLAQIFSRVVLGKDLPPESKPPARYRLNVLKRRGISFPTEVSDNVREVRIKALRLGVLGGGKFTVDAGPLRDRVNVYDVMDRSLLGEKLPLVNVDVQVATLQMVFAWPDGPRTFTFTVHPDHCTLGESPEEKVARRCLDRTEIVCV
jgi:hypothetical protein